MAVAGYFIGKKHENAVFENGMMRVKATIIFALNVKNTCSYKDVAKALGVDEKIIEDLINECIADGASETTDNNGSKKHYPQSYQSIIDRETLPKATDYSKIAQSYVIVICTYDEVPNTFVILQESHCIIRSLQPSCSIYTKMWAIFINMQLVS